jgi:adenine deaminase
MNTFSVCGNLVSLREGKIFPATIWVKDGYIAKIEQQPEAIYNQYLLPGFIDAHVHIESSLLVPSEFARLATVHGTVACVSDPHEIANVLGLTGIRFMVAEGKQTPFKIAFGAPSCVPATDFETAGAKLSATQIQELFEQDKLLYLSEMMNFPGVLNNEPEICQKIHIAHHLGLSVDGHAPGLRGQEAYQYASAGISTEHECFTLSEAHDKLAAGMKILIREGSAAKNYHALHPLIASHPNQCMFCSDDKHPHDLVKGHINDLVKRSVDLGYELMDVLKIACLNPVEHYHLPVGLLCLGDPADFIVVDNLRNFKVQRTYCQGILAAEEGKALLPSRAVQPINFFATTTKTEADFYLASKGSTVRVIEVYDGQLLTREKFFSSPISDGAIVSDIDRDLLKLVSINRYRDKPPALALVHNFGLKSGAIASSIAHDSHNILAVGTTDKELCQAVNGVIEHKGGLAVAAGNSVSVLPLPIAGLMSDRDGYEVARDYGELDRLAKQLGSNLSAPFMALSFLALLVIPDLKLSDRGLFHVKDFDFVSLFVNK